MAAMEEVKTDKTTNADTASAANGVTNGIDAKTEAPSNSGNDKEDSSTDANDSKETKENETKEEPVLPTGSKIKLKILQERYNKEGSQETVEVPDFGLLGGADSEYAVVARQIYTEKNRLESTRVTINSPHILKAFKDVVRSYPTLAVDFNDPFDMEGPFQMLHHYWDELNDYRTALEDEEARQHLDVLFEYMNQDLGKEKRIMEAMLKKQQIDFQRAWLIYRPGDLVVTHIKGHPWLMEIAKTVYDEDPKCGNFMRLHLTYTDYDGNDVGVMKFEEKLLQRKYWGQANPTDIFELPIFPRKFLSEGPELEERLAARGEKFLSLQGVCTKHYDGLADHLKESPPSYWDPEMDSFPLVWLPFTESGRVIIDRKTFQEDFFQGSVSKKSEITKYDRTLCPPFAYGYSFSRNEWCRFYLPCLGETHWKQDAFESLILPQKQLNLVRALVSSHKFPENARNQVEQKGKGLVCLLHGPPGSGKTLTAECATEVTQRALFSVSMSELNKYNDAYWFEVELKKVLRLATIWHSIVLFDEADVFLEARSEDKGGNDAAARNALVAVFLRHLEYFSGIVFLTTNRIHVFDAAMKSRVHLALGYSAPSLESRRRIWAHALAIIPQDERNASLDEAVAALADENLNGREISNTINTACTLARFEKIPLDHSHIQNVLSVRIEFEKNLKRIRANSISGQSPIALKSGSVLSFEPEEIS